MGSHEPPFRRDCLLVPGLSAAALARAKTGAEPAAVARLRQDAEAALAQPPPSLLDKKHLPPSGDMRDFFSLSIYFWPDPAKPDGLPYIPRDGLVNPETEEYDRAPLMRMVDMVDTLAVAWSLTGDQRYAAHAAACLRTWFLDPRTGMLPRMLFPQYIPGDDVVLPWKDYPARFVPGSGGRKGVYVSFGGVIEDLHLVPLTDSIRLLRGSAHWSDADDDAIRRWYGAYTDWLLTHQHGLDEAACHNNHASWYWADIACFREFTGQTADLRQRLDQALRERLAEQIAPDGSQPEELVRAVSQSYTAFGLMSFTNIATSCAQAGIDAWQADGGDGRSIRAAVDWFLPYLLGNRPWTWKQIKPFEIPPVLGILAAAAQRFPDASYGAALRRLRAALPGDHRFRLLYDAA